MSYRNLEVWNVAMDLVDSVYDLCEFFPPTQKYVIVSQLQKAVISIPANVAEGYGRTHRGDYLHHLSYSLGSLREVETYLLIGIRRNYYSRDQLVPVWELVDKTGRMLTNLKKSLQ